MFNINRVRYEFQKLGELIDCTIYNYNCLEIYFEYKVNPNINIKMVVNNIIYKYIQPYFNQTLTYRYDGKYIKLVFDKE